MQTRRKSLNLGDLGIVAAKRSRVQAPSPPETVIEGDEPPVKKSKRSHGSTSPPLGLMSPPRTTSIRIKEERPRRAVELSPPPSPVTEGSNKIDTEGINDDIVVGTIQQIEKTGNRPHLVKELAAILATKLHCVEKYAFHSICCRCDVANILSQICQPVRIDLVATHCIPSPNMANGQPMSPHERSLSRSSTSTIFLPYHYTSSANPGYC